MFGSAQKETPKWVVSRAFEELLAGRPRLPPFAESRVAGWPRQRPGFETNCHTKHTESGQGKGRIVDCLKREMPQASKFHQLKAMGVSAQIFSRTVRSFQGGLKRMVPGGSMGGYSRALLSSLPQEANPELAIGKPQVDGIPHLRISNQQNIQRSDQHN